MKAINPESLGEPKGYANGMLAPAGGRLLFVAGQVGWGPGKRMVAGGFLPQFEQALRNVVAVVEAAGGKPGDIGRLILYVTDKREYLDKIRVVGDVYRRIMGRHFPAMALLEVKALVDEDARVEIEATAVIP